VVTVPVLPLLPSGKVDRLAVRALVREEGDQGGAR